MAATSEGQVTDGSPVSDGDGRQDCSRAPSYSSSMESLPSSAGTTTGESLSEQAPLTPTRRRFFAVLGLLIWSAASSALTMLNKVILSSEGFAYPMTLCSFGLLSSALLSAAAVRGLGLKLRKLGGRSIALRFLLVGIAMALVHCLGTLSYLYISVSFIQMLKTAAPIYTMIVASIARLETPTLPIVGSLVVIVAGMAITSVGEAHFNWIGFGSYLLSQVFNALRLVMTQLLLSNLALHPLEGLLYLAPTCTLCLWVGAAVFELRPMLEADALGLLLRRPWLYVASALLGFVVNVSSFMVLRYSSALTMKLVGILTNIALVVAACIAFGDELTLLQLCGYAIALLGFVWYHALKARKGQGDKGGGIQPGAGDLPDDVTDKRSTRPWSSSLSYCLFHQSCVTMVMPTRQSEGESRALRLL